MNVIREREQQLQMKHHQRPFSRRKNPEIGLEWASASAQSCLWRLISPLTFWPFRMSCRLLYIWKSLFGACARSNKSDLEGEIKVIM